MLLKEAQAASKVVPQDALRADLLSGSQMSRSARDPVDTAATRDLDEQVRSPASISCCVQQVWTGGRVASGVGPIQIID